MALFGVRTENNQWSSTLSFTPSMHFHLFRSTDEDKEAFKRSNESLKTTLKFFDVFKTTRKCHANFYERAYSEVLQEVRLS